MEPRLRVAICGGGISGLCFAVALSKYTNVDFHVYEAAERFKEIGAGVMIWERTWTILGLMGLSEQFSKVADTPPDGSLGVGFDYRRSDQPTEGFRFHLAEMPYGCIRFHRAEFLDVFIDNLPKNTASFGKRLTSYSARDEEIHLRFHDGSEAVCDLLVGCDGIKSVVRRELLETLSENSDRDLRGFIEPVFSGTVVFRALIPADRLPKNEDGSLHASLQRPMMHCGKSKHVVSYSIAQGKIANVVALTSDPQKEDTPFDGPWVTPSSKRELLECFSGWEPEVQSLLQCVETPMKWAIHALKPLPVYVSSNVALIGDAAHAMCPHQGAGAGQAIEDAYVLAKLLACPLTTRRTLANVLQAYEHIRLPIANAVLEGSRASGLMYEFNCPGLDERYEVLGPAIQKQWDWVWGAHPDEEVARGIIYLESHIH